MVLQNKDKHESEFIFAQLYEILIGLEQGSANFCKGPDG